MREILFKAKRLKDGKWVEGYYIYRIKRTICPFGDSVKPEDEQHVIMMDGFSDWNMQRDTVHYDIDPNTLCQYTGLTDRNGNKIWENDIVNNVACEEENGEPCYTKVVFHKGAWYLKESGCEPQCTLHDSIDVLEVVTGNIFDNPELLEAADVKS